MSILTRYILRQHIGPFFFAFSVITFLWILNLIFKQLNRILSKGLEFLVVVEFLLLNIAWIVALTVPFALLMASLMTFGRMGADNEITALKANGVSLLRILMPALGAATALALLLVWFNSAVLPDFNHRLATLMRDIGQKKPALNIEPGIFYDDLKSFSLIVATLEDSADVAKVTDVLIRDNSDKNVDYTLTAKRGTIRTIKSKGLLEIALYDGRSQQVDITNLREIQRLKFDHHVIRIGIADQFLQRSTGSMRSDREKSVAQLSEDVDRLNERMVDKAAAVDLLVAIQLKNTLGSSYGMPLPTPQDSSRLRLISSGNRVIGSTFGSDAPGEKKSLKSNSTMNAKTRNRMLLLRSASKQRRIHADLRTNLSQIKSHQQQINRFMVEIHKKYSIPFACIVFVLAAAPLGARIKNGNMGMSFGVSLFFFLIYWISLIAGEDLADNGSVSPFLSMWAANIIVGLAALYILYVTLMEKELFNWSKFKLAFDSTKNRFGSKAELKS